MNELWADVLARDRREAQYSRPRKTRTIARWLFFVPDWLLGLTIVVQFDRPWYRNNWEGAREVDHLLQREPPKELGRLFVMQWHPKPGRPKCWLVLEYDPRTRADPLNSNTIHFLSWHKRPPLAEAARLLNERIVTTDAAQRLGWDGKAAAE